jgi:hypothetical protein
MLDNVKAQRACYGPQLGYFLSLVGLSSKPADVAETILLTFLVLRSRPTQLCKHHVVTALF